MNDSKAALDDIIYELLKTIRGRRSQRGMNRILKCHHNLYGSWELGKRRILWIDFLDICRATQTPFRSEISSLIAYYGPLDDTQQLIQHLSRGASAADWASRLELSESKVRRWASGKTPPSLGDVLHFLKYRGVLDGFIMIFSKPSFSPAEPLFENPEAALILCYLELKPYKELEKHDNAIIAEALNLTTVQVATMIDRLIEAGAVTWHQDKLQVVNGSIYTGQRGEKSKQNRLYWMNRAITTYQRQPPAAQGQEKRIGSGHHILAVDRERLKEIAAEVAQCFDRVSQIAQKSNPEKTDRIIAYNFQMLKVFEQEMPPGKQEH